MAGQTIAPVVRIANIKVPEANNDKEPPIISIHTAAFTVRIVATSYIIALPAGYTQPTSRAGYPAASRTPYLEVLSNSFGTLKVFSGNISKCSGWTNHNFFYHLIQFYYSSCWF